MDRPVVTGKGSYTKSKTQKGVYYIRHNMGKDPITGKYRYSPRRKVYAPRKSDLTAALEAYKAELNSGTALKRTSMTVEKYAREFHELREGTMGSPLSYKREALEISEICELLGNCPIQDLRPTLIKRAYADARKEGRFSDSELHKIHTKLSQIMDSAVADEIIPKNPCDTISVPRPKGTPRKSLPLEESKRLMRCLLSTPLDSHVIGTLIILDTGVRRGEMLGATWEEVSLEKGTIFISSQFAADKDPREPKSQSGRRELALSSGLLERLEAWKSLQRTQLEELGLRQDEDTPIAHSLRDKRGKGRAKVTGSRYLDPIEVVHMDPNNYGRWFREFCSDNGFGEFETVTHHIERDGKLYARGKGYRGLTPHMLRHTQATLLIGKNVDLKTVSTRLGHSTIKLTIDTYADAIAQNDRDAANIIGDLLGG